MMNTFLNALSMGGYGIYVWSSYGLVLAVLALQWLRPFCRLRRIKEQSHA